jgi:hypothetical protein
LIKLAKDPEVTAQIVFKKLVKSVIDHLSDDDRLVAIEAFKCANLLCGTPDVCKLLLVDDFLKALTSIMAAKKTLVQCKDLFMHLLTSTSA